MNNREKYHNKSLLPLMVVKTFMPSKTSICSNLLLETIVKTKKNTQKCSLCHDEIVYKRAFNVKIKARIMTCAIRGGGLFKVERNAGQIANHSDCKDLVECCSPFAKRLIMMVIKRVNEVFTPCRALQSCKIASNCKF